MAASVVSQARGERIFAIGDIHGCPDEANVLLNHLSEKEGITDNDLVVFLGDYIDRGPNSRGVIELMIQFKSCFPNTRFLKGNHEDMLLDFLGFGGRLGEAFLYNGGLETIQSYGISVFASPSEMISKIPEDHFNFFTKLESILTVDNYVLVHAGVNPLRDLQAQNDNDVCWIREEFIANVHDFEATVVFGHTPHQELFLHLPYKMGIDTGLVFGNKLSCLEIRSGLTLQVERGSTKVHKNVTNLTTKSTGGVA